MKTKFNLSAQIRAFRVIGVLSLVALTTACGDNYTPFGKQSTPVNPPQQAEPVEIRLTSSLEEYTTRASVALNDGQFASGEKAYAYVLNDGTQTLSYTNVELTADGAGNFSSATEMFYPAAGNAVSLFVSHPSLMANFPAALTHSVAANQTTSAAYSASDLMVAVETGVQSTANAVPLTFYHLLSKVRIAIVSGNGSPDLAGAKLRILNTQPGADFTPDITKAANRQSIAASGTVTAIEIAADISTNFTDGIACNDAVIVPQTLSAGTPFIELELAAGLKLYHKLAAATTFAGGTCYTYHITANLTGLSVASTITDWTSSGTVNGETTLP